MATATDTTLSHERYLALFRTDSGRLAEAAGRDLTAPVPYCDGWLARDLVVHAGGVWGHKAAAIAEGWPTDDVDGPPRPPPPGDGDDALGWHEEQRQRLLSAFASVSPEDEVWSWAADHSVRFWARRMAQEALIHRIDAEAATGEVGACDPDLVVDGIDEVLGVFLPEAQWRAPPGGAGDVVRLVSADREWRSMLGHDAIGFARGPGAADATVTADPLPLLLWLWGRAPEDSVSVDGDLAAVRSLKAVLRRATQ